jgi:cysteinyl-tRNA synthetase
MHELYAWAKCNEGRTVVPNEPTQDLVDALCDDLNTSGAITVMRDQYKKARKGNNREAKLLAQNCNFMGFRHFTRPSYFQTGISGEGAGQVSIPEAILTVRKYRAAKANDLEGVATSLEAKLHSMNYEINPKDFSLRPRRGEAENIERLIKARLEARADKDWAKADRIRDELAEQGITLKDGKDPETGEVITTWEVSR